MIHLLLIHAHAYTLQQYLDTWGRDVRGILQPRYYDDLSFGGWLKPRTYMTPADATRSRPRSCSTPAPT